ncbi:MAG: phosphatase PAP2 family protein [Verrucomicrobiota bacterium]
MLKHLPLPWLALVLALMLPVSAKDATKHEPYFDPKTFDFLALIPSPPEQKTDVNQKDIETVIEKQKTLTDEEIAHVKLEATYNTYDIFEDVIGPWFTKADAAKFPALARLIKREGDTTGGIVTAAKDHWKRPRPYLQDTRVHSIIGPVDGWSYPSGHSTRGTVDSLLLAQVDPGASEAILARGVRIGDDRVLGGVHFQTDVDAGRVLGRAIFQRLMKTPAFQADLAAAKKEVAGKF